MLLLQLLRPLPAGLSAGCPFGWFLTILLGLRTEFRRIRPIRSWAETTSFRFPQISRIPTDFFDLCGRIKGTQMAQMTQILTCSVWGFRRFREILLMTCRILCFIFGGFKKMRNFASIVKRLNYRRIDYGCLCCKPTL